MVSTRSRPRPVFLYFNSWGGSTDQAQYLRLPLRQVSRDFYTFTVQLTNYGGFRFDQLVTESPVTSQDFRRAVVRLTEQLLTQICRQVNQILRATPGRPVVLLSHSFGYTMLLAVLQYSELGQQWNRVLRVILLDPAGKSTNPQDRQASIQTYGRFIQDFAKFYQSSGNQVDPTVFQRWQQFIRTSTYPQFTRSERNTGMYPYILNCDNNSPLDLSIYAYGVEYWVVLPILRHFTSQFPGKTMILTSESGLAIADREFWQELGVTQFDVIGPGGHFIQIFNQAATITAILRAIAWPVYPFDTLGTTYNPPLNQLPPTPVASSPRITGTG